MPQLLDLATCARSGSIEIRSTCLVETPYKIVVVVTYYGIQRSPTPPLLDYCFNILFL